MFLYSYSLYTIYLHYCRIHKKLKKVLFEIRIIPVEIRKCSIEFIRFSNRTFKISTGI